MNDSHRTSTPLQVSYIDRYRPDLLQDPHGNLLAAFEFGKSAAVADPRHIAVDLAPLGGSPQCEVWHTDGPVSTGRWQDVRYAAAKSLSLGQLQIAQAEFESMAEATHVAYRQILDFIRQHRHPWPLKIWHYIPGINVGDGDQERYRQFCIGRAAALGFDLAARPAMPAATAIGTPPDSRYLQIYFLCGSQPGINVENPRQIAAPDYPRQYGPQSPLFSRGTLLQWAGRRQFLISGTASVVGHETHHKNDVGAQTEESLRNMQSLIGACRQISGRNRDDDQDPPLLKAYIRQPADLADAQAAIARSPLAGRPAVFLQGDICRYDLLAEVEGILDL